MIYTEQPKDFIPKMEVVGCLVRCGDKILLLHRRDHKPQGGKWGIPGGKVGSSDDNKKIAMLRELREETGLVFNEEDLNFHKTFFVSYPEYNFIFHYHHVDLEKIPDVIISENEHKGFSWVTLGEAFEMPLILDEDNCLKDFYGIN